MNRHRITILIGLVAGAAAALPGPALANPLLSGYGGPGQGNQAILGSALVNGPRGGGGSGGGNSGSSSAGGGSSTTPAGGESESTSSAAPPAGKPGSSSRGGPGASSGRGSGARRSGGRPATRKGASDGKAAVSAGAAGFYPAAERVPAGTQTGALGLSGEDVLLIALAIAALAIVAGFTRRLTRTAAAGQQR